MLALPVWMMIASLMVLVGTTGVWKLRSHSAAREAAAQSLWPRTTAGWQKPVEWFPADAVIRSESQTEAMFLNDPLSDHVVVKGPRLVDPRTRRWVNVDGAQLSFPPGATRGVASLDHPPAVWAKLGYRYRILRDYPLLNGSTGQFSPLPGDPRRARFVWDLSPFDLR